MARPRRQMLTIALALFAGCTDGSAPIREDSKGPPFSVGDKVTGLTVPFLLQADETSTIAIEEMRGSIVVLEFWATWCGPCVASIGHLNELADEFADNDKVRFISVTDEAPETITEFLVRKPIHTWIGIDPKRSLLTAFEISGIPTTVIINADGWMAASISPSQLDAQVLERIQNGELLEAESSGEVLSAGVDPSVANATPPLMQFVLRKSSTPSGGPMSAASGNTATMLGFPPRQLITQIFGLQLTRADFVAELPDHPFDLITRFPKSTDSENLLVQSAISSAFEIKIRHETRSTDVLILNPPEDGKHSLSTTASSGGSTTSVSPTGMNVVNGSLQTIAYSLENRLKRPILNETGLDGRYDFVMKWDKDATADEVAEAFVQATGLMLSAAQRDIDFTVIEDR